MTGCVYSVEEVELAGLFSKVKKAVKRSLNPIKQIKHDVKKVTKPLAKLAPLAPVLSFIPVVGTAVAAASKLAQLKVARDKAKAAEKAGAAEAAQYQAETAQLQQEYAAMQSQAAQTPSQVVRGRGGAMIKFGSRTGATAEAQEQFKRGRERLMAMRAEKDVAVNAPPASLAAPAPSPSGPPIALPSQMQEPGASEAGTTFGIDNKMLLIGGGVAAAALVLVLATGSKKR